MATAKSFKKHLGKALESSFNNKGGLERVKAKFCMMYHKKLMQEYQSRPCIYMVATKDLRRSGGVAPALKGAQPKRA